MIELDGGGHYTPEKQEKDAKRTAYLESVGLKVVRVCNIDIDKNFYGACEYIDSVIKERLEV